MKKLPNCAICLCPIEVNIPIIKPKAIITSQSVSDLKRDNKTTELEDKHPELKYIWCTKCRHGGHLEHIKAWFNELVICPVADCSCICLEYYHFLL